MTEKFFRILICTTTQHTSEIPVISPDELPFFQTGGREPIEPTKFEEIFTVLTLIFVIGTMAAIVIYWIVNLLYDGHDIRIFVVSKRTNLYKTYHWKRGTGTEEHYVVYAKYPNSDRIHTLACDGYIYRKLHANKGYNVTVRFMWIEKVHREKLRSKKKK